ncbi:hypothetical protein Tsubulata_002699 [Turnera subulata]|uniref:DUF4283 domain-containing protein n=1 Tax=Turnera subulata TaxID=218843 RepID=A0A9Q0GD96_9ROSI|nr:hypothetical protein Tsubulata_002699 [Turnera subulata]
MAAPAGHAAEVTPEVTREEEDQRERSNKKAKMVLGVETEGTGAIPDARLFHEEPRRKASYKTMVAGGSRDAMMEDVGLEDDEGFGSEASDSEDEEDDDPFCPTIRLSSSDKKRIYQRWKNTLIVKLLGKKVGHRFLHRTLMNQWKPRGEIVMADMGNDFYLLQFNTEQDYQQVLYDGPWLVADHVLTVRRWQPCFDKEEAVIDRAIVWVQLPKLYQEYYDRDILLRIARWVGKPIKVDEVTLRSTRVKYARVCVEVDLTKPLVSKFRLHRRIWRIVYEGLSTVCFMCGLYGHTLDACRINAEPSSEMPAGNPSPPMDAGGKSDEVLDLRPELEANHGPWMLAGRRRRGKPKKVGGEASSSGPDLRSAATGSRFAVLNSSSVAVEVTVVVPPAIPSSPVVRQVIHARPVVSNKEVQAMSGSLVRTNSPRASLSVSMSPKNDLVQRVAVRGDRSDLALAKAQDVMLVDEVNVRPIVSSLTVSGVVAEDRLVVASGCLDSPPASRHLAHKASLPEPPDRGLGPGVGVLSNSVSRTEMMHIDPCVTSTEGKADAQLGGDVLVASGISSSMSS